MPLYCVVLKTVVLFNSWQDFYVVKVGFSWVESVPPVQGGSEFGAVSG